MFTGIVQAVGHIRTLSPRGDDARLVIDTASLDLADVGPGDSIAVNGVCLTAVELGQQHFAADVSAETLRATRGFAAGEKVNLEKALRLADRLGGHLVSGHVDGVGTVAGFAQLGASWKLDIDAPDALARYIAMKGSVAVDGVSLTVNAVTGRRFSLNLIPHTLAHTNFARLAAGAAVNLEIDLVARYVARMAEFDAGV